MEFATHKALASLRERVQEEVDALDGRMEKGKAFMAREQDGVKRQRMAALMDALVEARYRAWLALQCLDEGWQVDDILGELARRGYVIFHSDVLNERVAFVQEGQKPDLPEGVVAYTEEELRNIPVGTGPSTRALIHEAKKAGAVVAP